MAIRAGIQPRDIQAHHSAADGVPEANIDLVFKIGAALRNVFNSGAPAPSAKDAGKDVPEAACALPAASAAEIKRAVREGWLTGDETGSFHPDAPVTRAEFVLAVNKMLQRHCALLPAGAQAFPDVPKSSAAYAAILEATATHPVQPDK